MNRFIGNNTVAVVTDSDAAMATFKIDVKGRHNATLQGTILWVETGETQSFRSEIELLKLLESTLNLPEEENISF